MKSAAKRAFQEKGNSKTWPRGVWQRATTDTAVNPDVLRRMVSSNAEEEEVVKRFFHGETTTCGDMTFKHPSLFVRSHQ